MLHVLTLETTVAALEVIVREPLEKNDIKRVVERLFADVISDGLIDDADALLCEDFIDHWAARLGAPPGRIGFKVGLQMVRASFPDWTSTLEDVVIDGDKVAARWTVRGTHTGEPFMGIPATGKAVEMAEAGILQLRGDRVAQIWRVADELSLMKQLGAIAA